LPGGLPLSFAVILMVMVPLPGVIASVKPPAVGRPISMTAGCIKESAVTHESCVAPQRILAMRVTGRVGL
jgi:hypothetical protein